MKQILHTCNLTWTVLIIKYRAVYQNNIEQIVYIKQECFNLSKNQFIKWWKDYSINVLHKTIMVLIKHTSDYQNT